MRPRWQHRVHPVALLLLATVLASCTDAGPRLTQPGGDPDGWFGLRYSLVESAEPIIADREVILCLDRPGQVEILDVTLEETQGGLRLDAFATRPAADDYPDWLREGESLFDLVYDEGSTAVEVACPDAAEGGSFVHLGLQLSKSWDATARGHTLLVSYRPDGQRRQRTLRIPFGIVLCEGWTTDEHDRITPECDFIVDDHYFPDPD